MFDIEKKREVEKLEILWTNLAKFSFEEGMWNSQS